MATRLLGTTANNQLTAIVYPYLTSAVVANDFGAINALIEDDRPLLFNVGNPGTAAGGNATQIAARVGTAGTLYPHIFTYLSRDGLLHVPNRGVLKVYPGDWIGIDGFGWPILVAGNSVATDASNWVHTGNIT